ncbi:SoxR reducing system RseC family protein [Pseudoalteromonas aurantia]|uniref:Sigma-E factor negative regulatory protein RseC n=1 Tax=Pseudoalteromonas aurantia 208 TaxID=1314867 RepID=A0ABR9EDK0_9GAMM|nr:SoxR reducing system RseC family protein [Pseudoalteromonas aurantia]MBE0368852.1 sigma-E factor negative regulatory protein RseC [Pseudoalteromonas aurantia 208]
MIEQTLQVVSVDGTTAYLQAEQKPACAGCNGKCGSQIFSKLFGTHSKTFPIELEHVVEVGQQIRLSLDDRHIVRNAFFVYMFPLLGAFFALFIGAVGFSLPEPWQIFCAVIGGFLGFLIAKQQVKRLKHEVRLVKVYPISIPLTQIDGDCGK